MTYSDPTGLDACEFYNSLGKPGSDSSSSAYEQAVAHSLGSSYYQTGTPSGPQSPTSFDTSSFTSFAEHQMGLLVDVTTAYFSNAGRGFADSASGFGYSLRHPVKTAKTLWNEVVQTVAHPVITAQGIWGGWKSGISDFMQADAAGRAGIIGETAGHNGFDVTLAVLAAEAPYVVHNIRTGVAGKGTRIADDAFVRFDPAAFDKSIDSSGILQRYFGDNKVWLTQYKYVKEITDPKSLETILYRQNLWSDVAGKFDSGATLRLIQNAEGAVPAGVTNMVNGIPQWRLLRDIPANDLKIITTIGR